MDLRVLMVTSEWPTPEHPHVAPFIVRQVEFLRKHGVTVEVVHFRGYGNPLRYLQAWIQIQSSISQAGFDLVHAQFGQSGLLAGIPKRLPLVVTFRGSDVLGVVGKNQHYMLSGRVLQLISRLVAKMADQAIVVSERLIDFLPHREYHVVPSGLDLALFKPMPKAQAREQLGFEQDIPLVLFSGSPSDPRKRHGLACQVVEMARKNFPNVRLVKLESVPYSQVPDYLNACDALLSTSMHEGSPNMVKEALACNLPVVSTDVGDVRQRIGGIEGCYVCVTDHPDDLSSSLVKVLSISKRIDGRKAVFSLDEGLLSEQVVKIYQLALEKRQRTL